MGATRATGPVTTTTAPVEAEPTLAALVTSASRDLSALVRDEVELAKAEIKDDVRHAGVGMGMFVGAAVLAFLASIVLSFAIAYALFALGLDRWLAFLIVGVVYLLVAGLLGFLGSKQVKRVKPPQETIDSTKRTVTVLKGAAKPAKP